MGLFPCTFKRASSVFLTVALGLCVANVRATKIEFSVPASEIDVPDQQKELKKEAKAALKAELSFKSALNAGPMSAPVMVAPMLESGRDPFARDKDKEKSRNGRPSEPTTDNRDT